jgi:hypothetical protein
MKGIDFLVTRFRGHDLSVMGEQEVGKTHLQSFLRSGSIPSSYVPTMLAEDLRWSRRGLFLEEARPKRLALKAGLDVPGSRESSDLWRQSIEKATIVLYLFRADLVYEEDAKHVKRISEDSRLIRAFLKEMKGRQINKLKAAFVGTHSDLIPTYRPPGTPAFTSFELSILDSDAIRGAQSRLGEVVHNEPPVVVGSMRDLRETRELVERLFTVGLKL